MKKLFLVNLIRHLILTKEAMLTLFPATSLVAKVTEAGVKKYSLSSSSDSEEDGDLPDNIFSKKYLYYLLLLLKSLFKKLLDFFFEIVEFLQYIFYLLLIELQ